MSFLKLVNLDTLSIDTFWDLSILSIISIAIPVGESSNSPSGSGSAGELYPRARILLIKVKNLVVFAGLLKSVLEKFTLK